MNKKQVKNRIAEFARTFKNAENDEIALLEVALFVEDVFEIVLSDNEICEKNLGNHQAVEKFILEKLHIEEACVESVE